MVAWHVDDLKISYADPSVVTALIEQLKCRYGKEASLTIKRGKLHDYLGMVLDYETKGKVKIDMRVYLETIMSDLPEQYNDLTVTPTVEHLFKINEGCQKLEEKDAMLFHTIVAKLLFLCKRARSDIQTVIAFLATRVK